MHSFMPVSRLSFAVLLFGLSGCLRPSEERARRDLTVGHLEEDNVAVDVRDGLAAVRELSAERLVLWASAPTLAIDLEFEAQPAEFEFSIHNCMPQGLLHAPGGVDIEKHEREVPTRCRYTLNNLMRNAHLEYRVPNVDAARPFRFAVLSDVQEAIEDVQDVFETVNAQTGVSFLFGAGDLTQRGTVAQLRRFQRELLGLNVPYYTTLGNHELGEEPPPYQDLFGRASFTFKHHGVRFSLLDSGSATIDPLVYDWLDDWLDQSASEPHVVAMHIPPLDPVGVRNGAFASRNEAAKLLAKLASKNVDLTLYGHVHSYYHFDNAGIPAHISGGGGAIPEKFDGIDRHILVIDADPTESDFDVQVVRVD